MEEKTVQINDIEVHYKIAGEGSAILILHGWGSKSDRWVETALLLAKQHFSVIIPDLPGFGKSSPPGEPWSVSDYCSFVEKFVDTFGLQTFYLLGHSFGGGLALQYTSQNPRKVTKLFLIGSSIFRRKTLKKQLLRHISKLFKLFSFLPLYSLFRKGVYKYVIRKSDYPYAQGVLKETYLKIVREDLSHLLSSVAVSTVIIWGQKDDSNPVSDAHLIHKAIKNSQLVIIPEGDHDLERHMPDVLGQKILEYIQ